MRANFNKRMLDNLPAKQSRYTVMDETVRGLGILVHPSGQKSFFHVRKILGRPERRTLGAWPELTLDLARGKAGELNGELAKWKSNDYQGASPVAHTRSAGTLSGLIQTYIERHLKMNAKNPQRAEKAVRYLEKYIVAWKDRPLGSIQRQHVLDLHAHVSAKHGKVQANRLVQFLRRMFYFAEDQEIFKGENPAKRVKLHEEHSRERYVTVEEMPRFLAALETEKNLDLKDFIYLCLFGGARSGDVVSARWNDINLEQGTWHVPEPKNALPYDVVLHPETIKSLQARPRTSEFVFPSFGVNGYRHTPKVAWHAFLKRAGIVERLTPHDLRRSLGSWQAANNESLAIIGKSLGHSSTAATAIYARLGMQPVRRAVVSAGDAMLATRKKKPLAVVPQPSRKRKVS